MKRFFSTFLICLFAVAAFGDTIYIDANGTGDYPTIQAAIDAATNGDVIILQPGTYRGSGNKNIDYLGKAITVRSTNPDEQSVVDSTIIDCENSGRGFVFDSNEGHNSVLAGLTITNGYAAGGGGVYCSKSSPTITKCRITNNGTPNYSDGGGILCKNSNAIITNNTISYNTASWDGGGIYCGGKTIIRDCNISNNSAPNSNGGGICCISGLTPILITNCTIKNNTSRFGSGIFIDNYATIANCVISGNSGDVFSGAIEGIEGRGGQGQISNCIISDNTGAGLYAFDGSISNCIITNNSNDGGIYRCNGPISNCLIANNSTDDAGGGIEVTACSNTISNCTITGNGTYGIYSWFGSNAVFHNCLVWGNGNYQIAISDYGLRPSSLTFLFCDVEGGTSSVQAILCDGCTVIWGDGNFDLDPCFIDAANGNYQLKTGSPCVNAGDPNYAADPCEKDLYGDSRILFDRLDIGCDEWSGGADIRFNLTG